MALRLFRAWREKLVRQAVEADGTRVGVSIRLHGMRNEISILFGSLASAGLLGWLYIAYNPDTLRDGISRVTLTRAWGTGPMYLAPAVLRSTPSHRLYSLLHAPSGDCFVYCVHFPTGHVYSARLKHDTEQTQGIDTSSMRPILRFYLETKQIVLYTPQSGVAGAVQAWWDRTKEKIAKVQKEWDRLRMSKTTSWSILLAGAADEMLPWAYLTAYWTVTFPMRRAYHTLIGENDPTLGPEEVPGNPGLEEWKATASRFEPGAYLGGLTTPREQVGLQFSESPFDPVRYRIPAVDDNPPLTLTLQYDEWATKQMRTGGATIIGTTFTGMMLYCAAIFRYHWTNETRRHYNVFFSSISKTPGTQALVYSIPCAVLSTPCLIVPFLLVGHYYYENRLLETSDFVGYYMYSAVALGISYYATCRAAVRRLRANELVVHKGIKSGVAARRDDRFREVPRNINISLHDRVDLNDLNITPVIKRREALFKSSEKAAEWRAQVAEYKKKMLANPDAREVVPQEESPPKKGNAREA